MRYKKQNHFIILLVILILILISFVSAGYVWNGKEYVESNSGEKGNPITIGTIPNQVLINNAKLEKNSEGNIEITANAKGSLEIEIRGKKYPIDMTKENKFVFDEKGELIKGTTFTTEQAVYNINGFEIPLPKDSKVTYEKDKVIIELSSDSKISVKGDGKGLIEFKSKAEIELESGLKLKGLKENENQLSVFFDGDKKLFYINQAEIDNKELGKLNKVNTYLFSDEIPKDFNEPALLIKNNKFTLKASSQQPSADITYTDNSNDDNRKLNAGALKNGEIELTFTENANKRVDIIAKENYYLVNGKFLEHNGELSNLNEKGKQKFTPTDKGVTLHVTSFDENNQKRQKEYFYYMPDSKQEFFVGYLQENGVYKKQDGSLYVDNEQIKTSFDSLTKEQQEKYFSLDSEQKLTLLKSVASGSSFSGLLDKVSIVNELDTKTYKLGIINPKYKDYKTIYEDILAHNSPDRKIYSNSEGGQLTTIHEGTHEANNKATLKIQEELRNNGDSDWQQYDSFYFLNDDSVALLEPGFYKEQIYNYLPSNMQGSIARFYLLGSVGPPHSIGPNSNYIYDEWTASIVATKGGVELIDNNQWTTTSQSLQDFTDFTMCSIAAATAVYNNKQNYWNANPEYKKFMRYNLIESKNIYDKVTNGNYNNQFFGFQTSVWNSLRTSNDQKTTAMRNTIKAILGPEDTKKYFGF